MKGNYKGAPARSLLAMALAGGLALGAAPAMAQSTGATIRGQVMADSAPAANAQVIVVNPSTGLRRTVQASADGRYAVAGLPPGTYRIEVQSGGQTTTRELTVQVGQTATLDLGVGGVAGTATTGEATTLDAVQVVGAAVEMRTSEVATYISNKQIEALPQNSRNFLAFADTAPGVQFITDASGNTRLRSGAQSANAVNVFIDGVGQKNYVTTGGISGQDTSRGNPFPQSAIGEYKVITQNYKAEYDQLSSAAVVAATRSGSNEFQGSFFWDYTMTDWRAATDFEKRPGATKAESKQEQYGVSFGGPIVQDRAHFFLAYEAKEFSSPRTFRIGGGYDVSQLPPDLQSQFGTGTYTSPFKEDLYFGKIDWLIGENHYFELTAKYRDESETIQVGDERLPQAATLNTNDETRVDLRWQWTVGDWLNDAHLTYEDAFWSPQPAYFIPGYFLVTGNNGTSRDGTLIVRSGGSDNYQDKGQKGWSFQDDLTFTGISGHTIKMGVKYKRVDLETLEQNRYNPQFFYDINESLTVPIRVQFGAPVAGFGDGTASSDNSQFGIYIQDDWEVNDHLTLNLGVRWDVESTPAYEDYVTPAEVVTALQNSNTNLPNSGVDINDYISTGGNRDPDRNNWAPRFGFSYDLNADQRHVIFGGAGRSYDRNLFDYLQNEISKASWGQYVYDFNTALHPCDTATSAPCREWDPRYLDPDYLRSTSVSGAGREVFLMDNNLVVPYSDQFGLGMRNAFEVWGHDWQTEVMYSYVRSHDGIAFLLGNRRPDGLFFPPTPPDATDPPPWGQGFAPFSNLILGQNALETKTNSVYVKLEKPYTRSSGWAATFAYTYTDSEQNSPIDGFPGAFNAERIEDYGWFPGKVPKNRVVASGIWDGPWDLTFSGKGVWSDATPRYYQNCNVSAWAYCYFDSYTPDDDFKQVDVAVEKVFDTGSNVALRLRFDVLNIFDWTNYSGYEDWRGGAGEPQNPLWGTPNAIALPTRTFKLSIGIDW
ncbi:TonB-dependent receptor [Pseudoxanthomonas kaohsiungensis]|uniref:TonB-dependent receptor n=1 Tax=Pseudoxanthomonas kaohsiungensis TaxID=283923 RepID=UPI0035AFCA9C